MKYYLEIVLLFFLLPFIILVILPAFIAIWQTGKKIRFNLSQAQTLIYLLSVTVLSVLANLYWNTFLFNRVYYEWDRVFLPFTLLSHESPVLDNSTWILPGYTPLHLSVISVGLTFTVLVLASGLILAMNWRSSNLHRYKNLLFRANFILVLVSLVVNIVLYGNLPEIVMAPFFYFLSLFQS